jgi:uncharacterized protein YpmB
MLMVVVVVMLMVVVVAAAVVVVVRRSMKTARTSRTEAAKVAGRKGAWPKTCLQRLTRLPAVLVEKEVVGLVVHGRTSLGSDGAGEVQVRYSI